jgi:glycosyltransferase involved in cell wall biosynthesis
MTFRNQKILLLSTETVFEISSWSNIPFFFYETLLEQKCNVSPYLIKEISVFKAFTNRVVQILNFFRKNKIYWDYSRSLVHRIHCQHQVWLQIKKTKPDLVVALSFSIDLRNISVPYFLFSDWTFEYLLVFLKKKTPNFLEKKFIEFENSNILLSKASFSLFPYVCEYVNKSITCDKVVYLGNVVNAVKIPSVSSIKKKIASRQILFIGRRNYRDGAQKLIEAYLILSKRYPDLRMSIVGLCQDDFEELPQGVSCFGYLDKGKDEQRALYYGLLENASLIVNPTPGWPSFSSIVEAMFFYTPVLITKNSEMVNTFGDNLAFGSYVEDHLSLEVQIEAILFSKNYAILSQNAHDAVKEFSWNNYIKKFLLAINM